MIKQRIAGFTSPLAGMLVAFNMMAASQAVAAQTAAPKTPAIENHYSISINPLPFGPLSPYGVIGGLAGAALLMGGYAYRRRMKIAVPYVLACGTVVTLLLNPEIVTQKHEKIPTEVIVAIDKSASQTGIRDRSELTSSMQSEVTRALEGLGRNLNIRIIEIDSAIGNEGTQLFSSFNGLSDLDPRHVGAVIALTDGQIGDVPATSPFPKGTPFHGLISGRENEKDRVVKIESVPRFGLVGVEQTVRVTVQDLAAESGKPVALSIKGESDDVQTIEVMTGESVEIKVKLGHVGPNVLSIEAASLEGELTEANNRIVTSIQGIQEAVNVLLVSGAVNTSGVLLRDIFKSDPNSNLIHLSLLRLPYDDDSTPRSERALTSVPLKSIGDSVHKFDLIVFDHYLNMNVIPLPYMNVISNHVSKGGAMLVLAGSEFAGPKSLIHTPLGALLPVKPTGNILETEAPPRASLQGQHHPILRGLDGVNAKPDQEPDWGPWVHAVDVAQTAGTSVMETPDGKPLLVLSRVEKGRVAVLLSDSLPLWKMGYKGGGPYSEFLRRVSHWLMKNPNLEEEALRLQPTEDGRKLLIERRTMADSLDPVTMTAPDGKTLSVELMQKEPGLWVAELEIKKNGVWQGRSDGAQSLVAYTHIGPANAKEMERVISTSEILKPLADKTGGVVTRMQDGQGKQISPAFTLVGEGEKAGEGRLGIREVRETILRGLDKNPLIPGWLGALLITGLLAYGYYREGDPKRLQGIVNKALGRGPEAGV